MLKLVSKYLHLASRIVLPSNIDGTTNTAQAKYSEIFVATQAGIVLVRPLSRIFCTLFWQVPGQGAFLFEEFPGELGEENEADEERAVPGGNVLRFGNPPVPIP